MPVAPTSPILNLPDELLALIMEQLPRRAFLSTMLVCHAWREISEIGLCSILHTDVQRRDWSSLRRKLENAGGRRRITRVLQFACEPPAGSQPQLDEIIDSGVVGVEELYLNFWPNVATSLMIPQLKGLRNLQLATLNSEDPTQPVAIETLISQPRYNFPFSSTLTSLTILHSATVLIPFDYVPILATILALPRLSTLELRFVEEGSYQIDLRDERRDLLSSVNQLAAPRIKSLTIRGYFVGKESKHLYSSLSSLESYTASIENIERFIKNLSKSRLGKLGILNAQMYDIMKASGADRGGTADFEAYIRGSTPHSPVKELGIIMDSHIEYGPEEGAVVPEAQQSKYLFSFFGPENFEAELTDILHVLSKDATYFFFRNLKVVKIIASFGWDWKKAEDSEAVGKLRELCDERGYELFLTTDVFALRVDID